MYNIRLNVIPIGETCKAITSTFRLTELVVVAVAVVVELPHSSEDDLRSARAWWVEWGQIFRWLMVYMRDKARGVGLMSGDAGALLEYEVIH